MKRARHEYIRTKGIRKAECDSGYFFAEFSCIFYRRPFDQTFLRVKLTFCSRTLRPQEKRNSERKKSEVKEENKAKQKVK